VRRITRRDFLRLTAAAGAFGLTSRAYAQKPGRSSAKGAHVVVIGGGFGGATCAKYLMLRQPDLKVTLVEPDRQFTTCPFSNQVIAGFCSMRAITQGYDTLTARHGIRVVHDLAESIEPTRRRVGLRSGRTLVYDRLVVSPGIDLTWGAIKYYDPVTANYMPHAWKAGAQTLLLKKKIDAMRDGGCFIIVAPPDPYRCPPGPYERASVVAHYLTLQKPKSKIIILDAKDNFSKKDLFMEGWRKLYPGMIEWVAGSKGGRAKSVDIAKMAIATDAGTFKGDAINVIPPQNAGRIAYLAGLVDDKGWCPVNPLTFESKYHVGIYVIGDAAMAGEMRKTAFAASSQAKTAAAAIVAALRGEAPADASYVDTCYSLLAPDYAISVTGVYRATPDGIKAVPTSDSASLQNADADFRAQEAKYASGWYASITADVWG